MEDERDRAAPLGTGDCKLRGRAAGYDDAWRTGASNSRNRSIPRFEQALFTQERVPGMPVDTLWHRFHNRNEAKRS